MLLYLRAKGHHLRVVDGPCRALYEHDVAVPFLVHQQISTTLIADDEMADENIFRDPFVTHLARLLAKDRSFVSEIGLDEFQPDQVVLGLEDVVGFILAMYNTAKSIFSTHKTLTLDEKFIRLIYSRFVLYPSFSQCPLTPNLRDALDPDALNYANGCYEEIKRNANQSQCKWDDMPLYTKFFEICVRVFLEEMKLDRPDIHLLMPESEEISSRSILDCAFKGVFSHVDWELNDKVELTQVSLNEKVILSPKEAPGPDSRLKEYALLYLYFDEFNEISSAWNKGHFKAARHDSDIRSCRFSLEEIMRDENLFLELYKNGLVSIRLWDGTVLIRSEEELYWDEVKHPGKILSRFPFPQNTNVPDLAGRQELYRRNISIIEKMVEAIKLRYGLIDNDKN